MIKLTQHSEWNGQPKPDDGKKVLINPFWLSMVEELEFGTRIHVQANSKYGVTKFQTKESFKQIEDILKVEQFEKKNKPLTIV